jgi:hypothetical protein
MQWRRGCLLAAVNLATAIPLIVYMDWQEARYSNAYLETTVVEAAQESATIAFDPCRGMWASYAPQEQVVQFGNFPAFLATYWRMECPPRWSVAGVRHINYGLSTPATRSAQKLIDLIFCLLIALQWFLLGSFPLTGPTAWWREPGMIITLGTALATCIALIPPSTRWLVFPRPPLSSHGSTGPSWQPAELSVSHGNTPPTLSFAAPTDLRGGDASPCTLYPVPCTL